MQVRRARPDEIEVVLAVLHIDLTVTDRDRSERFYADVLGFEVVKRVDEPDFRLTDMKHPGLDVEMCVRQPVAGDRSRFDELRTGLDHLSFRVASRGELESWQNHLVEHGVTYTPTVDTSYGAVLVFRDPDNIQLELTAEPGT